MNNLAFHLRSTVFLLPALISVFTISALKARPFASQAVTAAFLSLSLLLSTFASAASLPFGSGLDSIVTPQMFGAIADGSHHPLKQNDLDAKKGKWIGKYDAGDEWDYIGLQEAIYASFDNGTLIPNAANARLNKMLYLPPGNYLVNKSPTITLVHGGTIYGAGRLVSTVTSVFAGPAFQTNGCWYTQFTGICFAGQVAHDGAVFELDGNYDGKNKQGVQGNTFKDCFFLAGGSVSKAFALVRRGGNAAQGSENLFLDCHFQFAKFAGVYISGYNALQNTFIGGNIQACLNGIYVEAGSINVDSMGFQNGFRKQVEGGGFDIALCNSADDHSSVRNCRTESAGFVKVTNNHYLVLDNNNVVNAPPDWEWTPLRYYEHGAIVRGRTAGNADGHVYVAITSGVSGSSEPHWPGHGTFFTSRITTGSNQLSTNDRAPVSTDSTIYGIIVYGAGKHGMPLYSFVDRFTKPIWQLRTKAAVGVVSSLTQFGPAVTDGDIEWIDYEYNEAQTCATVSITNNSFKFGRTSFAGGDIRNNNFARADGLESLKKLPVSRVLLMNNHVTRNGGWNRGAKEQ